MNLLVIDGKAVPTYDISDRRNLYAMVNSSYVIIKFVLEAEQARFRERQDRDRAEYQESLQEYYKEADEWNAMSWITQVWLSTNAAQWLSFVLDKHWTARPTPPDYYYGNTDRIFHLMSLTRFMKDIEDVYLDTEQFQAGFIVPDPDNLVGSILYEVRMWREQNDV